MCCKNYKINKKIVILSIKRSAFLFDFAYGKINDMLTIKISDSVSEIGRFTQLKYKEKSTPRECVPNNTLSYIFFNNKPHLHLPMAADVEKMHDSRILIYKLS